ncbi:MAG: hypothetical protein NVSMB32_02260 [Actinomycetota bacterium]
MTTRRSTPRRLAGVALVTAMLASLTLITWSRLPPVGAATPSGGDPVAYAVEGQAVNAIDALSNVAVIKAPIPLLSCPVDIAITPDARYALVVTSGNACDGTPAPSGPQVVLIDTATNSLVPGIAANLPAPPLTVAIAPDGSMAFVVIPVQPNPPALQNASTGLIVPVAIGAGPTLTRGSPFAPSTGRAPVDAAVSADNARLYVLTTDGCDGGCLVPMTPGGQSAGPAIRVLGDHALVLAPDQSKAFVAQASPCSDCAGLIEAIDLATRQVSSINLSGVGPRPSPVALAIGTKPDGTATLYAADAGGANRVIPIPLATLVPAAPIPLETIPRSLAALPDGSRLEVTTGRGFVASVSAPGGPQDPCTGQSQKPVCPAGNGPLAITPDQRPVAALTATPQVPGQPTAFDASGSTIAYRSIASYAWDFGDGQSTVTAGPTTSHTYAHAGDVTVGLTETDSAGATIGLNPPSTIFTGHTMTRRGGPPAQTRIKVTIPTVAVSPSPSPSASPSPQGRQSLSIFPQVGPPGTVVLASGTGFPAHRAIALQWAPGVGFTPVTSDNAGAFKAFVLVLPHDQLGPRKLLAQGYTVSAPFLVVPISLAPGGSDNQVVFRR